MIQVNYKSVGFKFNLILFAEGTLCKVRLASIFNEKKILILDVSR